MNYISSCILGDPGPTPDETLGSDPEHTTLETLGSDPEPTLDETLGSDPEPTPNEDDQCSSSRFELITLLIFYLCSMDVEIEL